MNDHIETAVNTGAAPLAAALRPQDRAGWELLARGYMSFYERTLPDAAYEHTWRRLMQGDRVYGFGVEENGRLVGITHFLFHTSLWDETTCYLQDLFVDTATRGRGVARALIEAVAQAARGRGAARLYWLTRADNTSARALYDKVAQHQGFVRYDYPLNP